MKQSSSQSPVKAAGSDADSPKATHAGPRAPGEGRPEPSRATILAGALGVGIAANLLLRVPGEPGLNLFLLFLALAGALTLVHGIAPRRPSLESGLWIATGLLMALVAVFRSAPALQIASFLAAALAFAFAALAPRRGWLGSARVSDPVEAVGGALLRSALGPLGGMGPRAEPGSRSASPGWALLRGALLALPLLFLFGALLMGADPTFAHMVTDRLGEAFIAEAAGHLALTALLAWFASGYLVGSLRGTRVRGWVGLLLPRPRVGTLELGVVLLALDLLFATFVVVQLPRLFGGVSLVQATPDLTFAEYARQGFGQLLFATALVLPLLLAVDWLGEGSGRGRDLLRLLAGVQLGLLLVMVASALHRVVLYQSAYGLTESRLHGAAFLVWIGLVALWFGATVLRDRRRHFTAPVVVSVFLGVTAMAALNPQARIAGANLSHEGPVDAPYLATLGADAVPALLRALPALPPEVRCTLAPALLERWGPDAPPSSRWNWTLARTRARALVGQASPSLLREPGCAEVGPPAPH